jgi:superfamily I DNA/RNA helicase
LSRIGRRYPISVEQRRAVWQLFEEYQRLLRERRLWDFADMLIQAERVARDEAAGSLFSHVIVDEVQDVSGVGLRMLHALVGDAPDGLLLVGDGQQQIFVGGYSLAEAGIDVRGRSTVLRNYRNTVQIIQAAREVVEGDTYADLDGREEPGERRIDAIRHGPEPIRMVAGSRTELDFALLDTLNRWRARPDMSLGDIAVLTLRNTDRQRLLRLLGRYGVPVIDLQGYRGATVDRVKVGTYHRAKGLEFKAVLLPMWNQVSLDRDAEPGCEIDATGGERRERDRRALFVAMTRARDELWLGSVRGPSGSG